MMAEPTDTQRAIGLVTSMLHHATSGTEEARETAWEMFRAELNIEMDEHGNGTMSVDPALLEALLEIATGVVHRFAIEVRMDPMRLWRNLSASLIDVDDEQEED